MISNEWSAGLQLVGWLLFDPRLGVLIALLLVAAWSDWRAHRIPNWLVFGGAAYALIYNTVFPSYPDGVGLLAALAGLGLGLALLLPFYLLRAMGAGDVKLMAMVGAFLGPWPTFLAVLATFLAGGVLAILFLLAKGVAWRAIQNVALIGRSAVFDVAAGSRPVLTLEPASSAGKLPYGIAIGVGTAGYLFAKQFGYV
ncbi:MAG: A24 family peptidase [Burkholderiales bacterium]